MGGAAAPHGDADWSKRSRARGGGESRAPPRYTRGRAPRAAEAGRRAAGADGSARFSTARHGWGTARHSEVGRGVSRLVSSRPVPWRSSSPALHGTGTPGEGAPRGPWERPRGHGTARLCSPRRGSAGFRRAEAVWGSGAYRAGSLRVGTGHPSGGRRSRSLTQRAGGDRDRDRDRDRAGCHVPPRGRACPGAAAAPRAQPEAPLRR